MSVGLVIFGIFLTLLNCHSEHRYTFYSFGKHINSPYHEFDLNFSGNSIFYKSRDEAIGRLTYFFHPNYFRKEQLLEWVLAIDVNKSSLFQSRKLLPHTISGVSEDLPHAILFDRPRTIFRWHNDEEALAAVEEKLSALEKALAEKIENEKELARTQSFAPGALHQRLPPCDE